MAPLTRLALTAVLCCLYVRDASSATQCPAGWVGPHRDTCYGLSSDYQSWHYANSTGCDRMSKGSYLASVTYNNKAFLSKQTFNRDTSYYWVGLRTGDTQWNKGTPVAEDVGYTNWERIRYYEPTGSPHTYDNCVLMAGRTVITYYGPPGKWYDWDCSAKYAFLCEYVTPDGVTCPDGWVRRNSPCMLFEEHRRLSFLEAERYCADQQRGATLASVPNYTAMAEVIQLNAPFLWIGLFSTPNAVGNLEWQNKYRSVVSLYQRVNGWAEITHDEPHELFKPASFENCVHVNGRLAEEFVTVGEWASFICDVKLRYLCALKLKS